jgi:hypothetical protein
MKKNYLRQFYPPFEAEAGEKQVQLKTIVHPRETVKKILRYHPPIIKVMNMNFPRPKPTALLLLFQPNSFVTLVASLRA